MDFAHAISAELERRESMEGSEEFDELEEGSMGTLQLSKADKFWLSCENPSNFMIIHVLLFFKEIIELSHLMDKAKDTLATIEKFTCLLSQDQRGYPIWVKDPNFDLRLHFSRIYLPPPRDDKVLKELVDREIRKPLDRSKPLWEIIMFEGHHGTGSCMLFRVHHAIGDGISLMKLFISKLSSYDSTNTPSNDSDSEEKIVFKNQDSHFYTTSLISAIKIFAQKIVSGAFDLATCIKKVHDFKTDVNFFKPEKLSKIKQIAWSNRFPLSEIKRFRTQYSVTVNDFILAVISGALRSYESTRLKNGQSLSDQVKSGIPVYLPSSDEKDQLGNSFALVLVNLCVDIQDPLERLHAIQSQMDQIKHSLQATIAYEISILISHLPGSYAPQVRNQFTEKISSCISNVPGPKFPVKICDHEVQDMVFFLPATGRVGLTVSVLSYCGNLRLGVFADENVVDDAAALVQNLQEQFDLYINLAN